MVNSGRCIGVWRIETSLKKCFFEVVEDGTTRTLIIIIKKIIEPGQSIILLDCWKAHYSLKLKGYQYLQVNHFTEIEKEKRSWTNFFESTSNAIIKISSKNSDTKTTPWHLSFWVLKHYLKWPGDKEIGTWTTKLALSICIKMKIVD